ncbi:Uncharacterised protein [Serratia quinivorans]|uniref:Uncharacterized protein n=1 Tax=Serratia quinivorans TaxID=137545 RepID=A0A380AZY4_9GAMM|nr:Uncharacterised protein [Serratia quinivorans]
MAQFTHFFVGGPIKQRAKLTHFIPDLLVIVVMHRIAHLGGQQADDLPVAFDVVLRFNGLLETLEAAIGTGEHAAMLTPGGGWQDHIGLFSGFGHKDVLHYHKLQRFERAAHQAQIGFGL